MKLFLKSVKRFVLFEFPTKWLKGRKRLFLAPTKWRKIKIAPTKRLKAKKLEFAQKTHFFSILCFIKHLFRYENVEK